MLVYIVQASKGDCDSEYTIRNVKAYGVRGKAEAFIEEAQPLLDAIPVGQEGHRLDPDAYPGETYTIEVMELIP